ncbi:MAG: glutathione S-transferase [Pseudomonadota bacterium]
MRLIGMLDSPFVRRAAISAQMLGLPYQHESVSVFRTYDQFRAINPVVKAPTLVCDDGEVLMDSTLIIDYFEAQAGTSLMPRDLPTRRRALKLIGLALAAGEKIAQTVYEGMRPAEKRHAPWAERVNEQLFAALAELEREVAAQPLASAGDIDQAGITVAVLWRFAQYNFADKILAGDFPALAAHSASAETLPAFTATPLP